jgi:hypothetical protein
VIRGGRLAATVALALAVAGCGPGPIARHGRVNEDALDQIQGGLAELRGLPFLRPVPARMLTDQELRALLVSEIERTYAAGDLERLSAVYERLGLLPPGTLLRPAMERLYAGQVAALYDPRTKTLSLVGRALEAGGFGVRLLSLITRRDVVGELLVAHELTHALQDQYWGIPTDPEPLTNSHGDRLLARRALLEGDATLASFAFLQGRQLSPRTIARVTAELYAMDAQLRAQYPDVPEAVRASLVFEYESGTAFAGQALLRGGWAAVDRAQADPPESSEQVLHPARYFERRDHPVEITLGGTEALEATGWTRTYEDTLGELDVQMLAGRAMSPADAARAADGWGGDRLRALSHGDALVIVWMTAWDSTADAAEFADALARATPDARVERREDRVLALLGPVGGPDLQQLAARVWRGTRMERRS